MVYLQLFWEFFKTGLFAIGGGYATLPFLFNIAEKYDWYTQVDLGSFIAISEVTPGAIGVNMATFAGFAAGGMLGGLIATLALVLPAFLIIVAISRFVPDFKEKPLIHRALYGLLPVATALIAVAGMHLLETALLSFSSVRGYVSGWLLLAILLVLSLYFKRNPFWLLGVGAVWGLVFL